jgi:uncharacterized membrane protein (DUF2068 family)
MLYHPSMREAKRGSGLLILIGIVKLAKAALLLTVAAGAHRLLHTDTQETLLRWAHAVRVDPENRFAHAILTRISGLSERTLAEISLATALYGLLFAVEGTGLLLRQRWAEWVTVISTAGFLPVELYEVIQRVRLARIVVLSINVLIVLYLIRRLKRRPLPDNGTTAAATADAPR